MKILQKWHSIGNDFLITKDDFTSSEIAFLCDRHFGLGADQFVIIYPNEIKFFNADGKEAEICGNALKCVGHILFNQSFQNSFQVNTKKGIVNINVNKNGSVEVNLGKVNAIKEVNKNEFFVDLGNPHYVRILDNYREDFFTSSVIDKMLHDEGVLKQKEFKNSNGINYSLACVKDDKNMFVRTFERGVGETFSCGSGSCAAFVSGSKYQLIQDKVAIFNLGSKKVLDFKESFHFISYSNNNIILEGKGTYIAEIKLKY